MKDISFQKAPGDLFSPRALMWVFSIGAVSFIFALGLMIFADDATQSGRAAAHPYSDSAIGHRAFVELMKELDVPTLVSRNRVLGAEERHAVQVLLEPPRTTLNTNILLELYTSNNPIFIVLPKWDGQVFENDGRYLEKVWLKEERDVLLPIRSLTSAAELVRPGGASRWSHNDLKVTPSIAELQLINADDLNPLVSTEDGVLLGMIERGGREIFILSDPDVLNNHGLDEGQNHLFTTRMIDAIRNDGQPLVIDATLHGFVEARNLWRKAFNTPYIGATLTGLLALLILIWASVPRFGGPSRQLIGLQPGKAGLIENTTSLLDLGGRRALILKDFLDLVTHQICAQLHINMNQPSAKVTLKLNQLSVHRGCFETYSTLRADIQEKISNMDAEGLEAERLAARVIQWRAEILSGSQKSNR